MIHKYSFLFLLIMLAVVKSGSAQANYWDMSTTEYLIQHNIDNYDDHQHFKNNQVESQATVSQWKTLTYKLKGLTDSIDQRLSSFFIITADVSTAIAIYTALNDMYSYQSQSIGIALKYPYTIPVIIERENEVIASASSFASYLTLIVSSYTDISKMKVSDRNIIYREIRSELEVVRLRCYSMLQQMKQIDFVELLKKTTPVKYINKDAQLVKEIIKNF